MHQQPADSLNGSGTYRFDRISGHASGTWMRPIFPMRKKTIRRVCVWLVGRVGGRATCWAACMTAWVACGSLELCQARSQKEREVLTISPRCIDDNGCYRISWIYSQRDVVIKFIVCHKAHQKVMQIRDGANWAVACNRLNRSLQFAVVVVS